jgi:hypothetical protein
VGYSEVFEFSFPFLPFDVEVLNVGTWWAAVTEGNRFFDFVPFSFKECFDAPIG